MEEVMKRVLAIIVSALVSLAFAGVVSAQQPYSTDTHPPIIENQPGLNADTATKTEKKAKKKKKKSKKAKKEMEQGTGTPGASAPNATETPMQPPPQQ
jgi:mannitol-specific phosphotransferase system IIBC component